MTPFGILLIFVVALLALWLLWVVLKLLWRMSKKCSGADLILIFGVLLLVVCGLFPPWLPIGLINFAGGYCFVFTAQNGAKIDLTRLMDECISIGALTSILYYFARLKVKGKQPLHLHLDDSKPEPQRKPRPESRTDGKQ